MTDKTDRQTSAGSSIGSALDRIGLTRTHGLIMAVALAGQFFDVFDQNGAAIAGPSLQKLWDLSGTQVSLLASTTFATLVVGGIATGILADIKGRRAMFAWSLAIYSLGSLVCAFAPNYEVLLLGRAITGLGVGGEITIVLPFVAELVPTKYRGMMVSLLNVGGGGLGNPASFMFGAFVIGVLGPHVGGDDVSWRWYFGLLTLPALIVLYVRRRVPETPRFLAAKGRIEEANRALSALASGTLDPKKITYQEYISKDAATEQLDGSPLYGVRTVLRGKLLKNTLATGIAGFMSFGGQMSVLTFMPILLVSRGQSIENSLMYTAVMQGGALAGAIAATFLNVRLPRRRVLGTAAILAGAFGIGFAAFGTTIPLILVFGFLFNFFVLICNTTIWTWVPECYPTRVRATGTGVSVNIGLSGMAVLPLVVGPVFDNYGVYAMFGLVAIGYLIVAVVGTRPQETFGRDLAELHGETA